MRVVPVVLAAVLLGGTAHAQQQEPAAEVHCESDQTKSNQDLIRLERECLAQLNGMASRAGDNLRLTLADGRAKTFTDERQACERHKADKCMLHRLAAYYPTQKLFVIERAAYESSNVVVVSRRTGSITRMDVRPHLAPSGKRMVAAAAIEAWDVEKEIAIYSVTDSPKLEWSYKAPDYEMWEFVSRDGDERVRLSVTLWTVDRSGARVLATQPAEVRRTILGWQLNKDISPDTSRRDEPKR
jgi:hypothetical protein